MLQQQVEISDIRGGIEAGYTKKESQQNAAKATLKKLKSDPDYKKSVDDILENEGLPEANTGEVQTLISSMTTQWVDNGLPKKPEDGDESTEEVNDIPVEAIPEIQPGDITDQTDDELEIDLEEQQIIKDINGEAEK